MSDSPADAVTLYDQMRATEHEQAAPRSGDGDATIEIVDDSHVDVAQAENQFHVLERRMTQHSTKDKDQDSVKTATVEGSNSDDPEKGKVEPERFDLREYLSSSNDANAAAGIKHKVCCSFPVFVIELHLIFCGSMLASCGKASRWTCSEAREAR